MVVLVRFSHAGAGGGSSWLARERIDRRGRGLGHGARFGGRPRHAPDGGVAPRRSSASCRRTSNGWRPSRGRWMKCMTRTSPWPGRVALATWRWTFHSREARQRSARVGCAKPGDVLAVSGPNGGGKSSCLLLLQACARGDAAPPPGLVLDGGVVAVPRTLIHVAQQPYCPLHAVPLAWATTRVEATWTTSHRSTRCPGLLPWCIQTNKTLLTEEQDDFCGSLVGRPAREV